MVKKLPFKTFKSIYARVPRLCVDLVIKGPKGILLTLRQIEPAGYWHLPGGTVLMDESIYEAVERVAKEELGTTVSVKECLGMIDYYQDYEGHGHPISAAFSVEIKSGEISLNNQATKYGFFEEIPENTFREQKDFLRTLKSLTK